MTGTSHAKTLQTARVQFCTSKAFFSTALRPLRRAVPSNWSCEASKICVSFWGLVLSCLSLGSRAQVCSVLCIFSSALGSMVQPCFFPKGLYCDPLWCYGKPPSVPRRLRDGFGATAVRWNADLCQDVDRRDVPADGGSSAPHQ